MLLLLTFARHTMRVGHGTRAHNTRENGVPNIQRGAGHSQVRRSRLFGWTARERVCRTYICFYMYDLYNARRPRDRFAKSRVPIFVRCRRRRMFIFRLKCSRLSTCTHSLFIRKTHRVYGISVESNESAIAIQQRYLFANGKQQYSVYHTLVTDRTLIVKVKPNV